MLHVRGMHGRGPIVFFMAPSLLRSLCLECGSTVVTSVTTSGRGLHKHVRMHATARAASNVLIIACGQHALCDCELVTIGSVSPR